MEDIKAFFEKYEAQIQAIIDEIVAFVKAILKLEFPEADDVIDQVK